MKQHWLFVPDSTFIAFFRTLPCSELLLESYVAHCVLVDSKSSVMRLTSFYICFPGNIVHIFQLRHCRCGIIHCARLRYGTHCFLWFSYLVVLTPASYFYALLSSCQIFLSVQFNWRHPTEYFTAIDWSVSFSQRSLCLSIKGVSWLTALHFACRVLHVQHCTARTEIVRFHYSLRISFRCGVLPSSATNLRTATLPVSMVISRMINFLDRCSASYLLSEPFFGCLVAPGLLD